VLKNSFYLPLCLSFLVLVGCAGQPQIEPTIEPTQASNDGRAIVIGDVSDDPDATSRFWQPLADYLAANLDEYDYGSVLIASDLDQMASLINRGEVDVYIDSPYPSLYVNDNSDGTIVLRHWRGGVSEYHSVFFTLKDTGVDTVQDLPGKVIALDKPASTSGNFLPRTFLLENGFKLTEVASVADTVPSDNVGYIFSGEDVNTMQWVMTERVAVGVTDSISYSETPESVRSRMKIIAETRSVPSQLVTVGSGLDANTAQAITDVLITMEDTPQGEEVLKAINTTRFDDVPGGIEAFRQEMENLLQMFQAEAS
jgi:phosphonate transport system substrate-binding protein